MNPTLAYGSTGGEVSWLKETLRHWGFYDDNHPDAQLGPDRFGWDLHEAITKMQATYGVPVTGIADTSTWTLMNDLVQGIDPRAVQTGGGTPQTGPYSAGPGNRGGGGGTTTGTPANRDAMARLSMTLEQFGLGGMIDWVRTKLLDGASEAEVALDMYNQDAFKARFPVIEARRKAGLTPVSAAEVIEFETRGREVLRRAGLTMPGLNSSEYLQGLMGADVSLVELKDRIDDGLLKVTNAPPEVRTAFTAYFGVEGDAALAGLFLDPTVAAPELEKKATTAYAGGIGARFGLTIAQGIAREIADTGVSDAGIWTGFKQIDAMRDLFAESISETTDLTAEREGIGSAFGTMAGATQTLERRAKTRKAQFAGGGGVAATEAGAVGIGVADS